MRSSIRKSMYRAVSLLIVLPVLLLSLILSYVYAARLENIMIESLQAVAASQLAEINSFCDRQRRNLEVIGEMEASRAALRGELDAGTLQYLSNMLYARVQVTDFLNGIAIIGTDNRVVAYSGAQYEPIAKDEISLLYDGMQGEPFWISDVLNVQDQEGAHKAVAALSRVEEDGRLLGYVLAELDLSFYDDIRQRAELWSDSTFYLLDAKEQIIIAGTPSETRDLFVTTAEERKEYSEAYQSIDFQANPQGNFRYQVNGHSYITYYANLQHTNWRMLLSVNLDNYLEQRANYVITAGVLVLFCTVLSLWIGRFTSRRIVQPIKHITETLDGIQKSQDYHVRVNEACQDELGTLSVEINQLLSLIETENLYQAQKRRQLQDAADRDALTKTLNREKIMQQLQDAIVRRRCDRSDLAVLFVDVDDFKHFNTTYGHDVGDQVLLFLSSLLTQETGGTVGRVGGDEFLVVVESPAHLQTLEQRLDRVNRQAESKFTLRGTGEQVPITVCIGAARVAFNHPNADEFTPEQLSAWADSAMYQAKSNGKRGYTIWEIDSVYKKEIHPG